MKFSDGTVNRTDSDPLDIILGISPAILQLKSLIRQVAPTDITVLITGESGTGKELAARSIHEISRRRDKPMVTVNCGAIPEGIFESEIFGHEKGSFTSAAQQHHGYFEMADRGTLFLDEIGEMPLHTQVKLLRVLETGRFLRVGGSDVVSVDVRVVAATNKDLAAEVNRGKFREDLFYRLKAISVPMPALRERAEDIPLLIDYFTREFSYKSKRQVPDYDPAAIDILSQNYWAGNVRELKNFVESLVALSTGSYISRDDIRSRMSYETHSQNLPILAPRMTEELDREVIYHTLLELRREVVSLKDMIRDLLQSRPREVDYIYPNAEDVETYSLDEVEKEQIRKTLASYNGNRRKAADALGIGERTLYRKIKQYNL